MRKKKQTLILVTATSTMFFLSRFRLLRPPSSSTSTEPRKCRRKTVPVAPVLLPPNGTGFVLNTCAPSKKGSSRYHTQKKNSPGFFFIFFLSLSLIAEKW